MASSTRSSTSLRAKEKVRVKADATIVVALGTMQGIAKIHHQRTRAKGKARERDLATYVMVLTCNGIARKAKARVKGNRHMAQPTAVREEVGTAAKEAKQEAWRRELDLAGPYRSRRSMSSALSPEIPCDIRRSPIEDGLVDAFFSSVPG